MEDKIICKECGIEIPSLKGLNNHILHKHQLCIKNYYDKWIKTEGEDICKVCGGKTEFYNFKRGYRDTCKKECANVFRFSQIKKIFKEKYGDEIIINKESIIIKSEATRLKRYGHKNSAHGLNSIKVEKTCKERYGASSYMGSASHKKDMVNLWNGFSKEEKNEISNKKRKTNTERYGFPCSLQNNIVHEKAIKTMLERHGVKYNMQSKELAEKTFKTQLKIKPFGNTGIWYQGTYELDFLEKYYDKFPDIQRGLSFKYNYLGKDRVYLSDFYIPSKNLIIEIKSSYYLKRDKNMILEKEKAVLSNGYKYTIIIDKNYKILQNGIISEV